MSTVGPAELYARTAQSQTGCWLWTGARTSNGYGHMNRGGTDLQVHRLSWEIANGRPIPDGLRVLHQCDVKHCINPMHLQVGTASRNSQEMVQRGRYRGPAKLTPAQCEAIKVRAASGETQTAMATEYGVSITTISNAVRGVHRGQGVSR